MYIVFSIVLFVFSTLSPQSWNRITALNTKRGTLGGGGGGGGVQPESNKL